jgi:hypothetical protein
MPVTDQPVEDGPGADPRQEWLSDQRRWVEQRTRSDTEPGRRRPAAGQASSRGSNLRGDVQRWLVRSSARNLGREIGGQVRRTLGNDRPKDVWGAATTEPPPGAVSQPPECAWCPICQAARLMRESGSGLGSQLSGAGAAAAAALSDALTALDAALSAASAPGAHGESPAESQGDRPGPSSSEGPGHEPHDRG